MSGLAITSLVLVQFRSHLRTRLAFDGRPVAIFGPNGAGKTNVLEAVSLLSPGRGMRRAGPEDLARKPEAPGWKVLAEVRGIAGTHEVETGAEGGATRQVRIDDKAATQAALGRILRVLWLVPAMDRLWIEAAEGRRRFLDRMALSFFPDHGEAVLAYDKAMRERNRLLKEQATDAGWYAVLESRMAEAASRMAANRAATVARLMAVQEGSETAFPRVALWLEHPEGEADDLALAWAEGRRRDMAAGRTLLGPHRVDMAGAFAARGVPAGQCSTGEQKALLISLILANARALAQDLGRAPVLLLDEVAAHLDSDRRAALYDEICALGAQAIMTGTEAGLFTALGDRAQAVALHEAGGVSHLREGWGEA